MATFGYEVINSAGKTVKGSAEADSIDKVRSDLKAQGMTIVKLSEQNAFSKDINLDIGGKPKVRDLSVFCRQFVSMLRSGVTILEALKMMVDATENKKLKAALADVRIATEKGESLSAAFSEHPKIFPPMLINMIAAGEASGNMDISFERMATQFERSAKTQALIKKAMVYPIVVCIVAIAVVVVMLLKVIPSYVSMFADMDAELPGITVMVMNASNGLVKYWMVILPIIIAIVLGITAFLKTDKGQHLVGKVALKVPAVNNLVIKSASAQTTRTLSTLLGSGIPLTEATEITAGIMGNVYFKEALLAAKDEIVIGQPLSRPIEECGLFPPMVSNMIRIGEETGNTEEMLDKVADYYEEEVEMAVQSLMAAMEPAIIIVLAVVVGTLVAACIAPMLSMYEALDNL